MTAVTAVIRNLAMLECDTHRVQWYKGNSEGQFERRDLPLNPPTPREGGLCICWSDEPVRTRGHAPARHLGWWANNFYDAALSWSDCATNNDDVHYITLSTQSWTEGPDPQAEHPITQLDAPGPKVHDKLIHRLDRVRAIRSSFACINLQRCP